MPKACSATPLGVGAQATGGAEFELSYEFTLGIDFEIMKNSYH